MSGPTGDRLLLWGQLPPSGKILRSSSRAAGAAFGVAETVPGPGTLFSGESVGAALGPTGQAVAVQVRTVVVTERPAAGVWTAPVVLTESTNLFGMAAPQAAVDPAGGGVATWVRFDGAHWVVEVSERAAGAGAWSAPVVLSPTSRDASRPALAVSSTGRAIVAWQEKRANTVVLRLRARASVSSLFGPAVTVGPSGPKRRGVPYAVASLAPRLGFASRGKAVAVWGSCFRGKPATGVFGRSCLVQAAKEK